MVQGLPSQTAEDCLERGSRTQRLGVALPYHVLSCQLDSGVVPPLRGPLGSLALEAPKNFFVA